MLTSKKSWVSTKAVVYSVERVDATGADFGHFLIAYSFEVEGVRYNGEFRNYLDETSDYVHSHDVITILYDPKNPKKNCYPKAFSAKPMILLYGGIALAVVLVIGAVLYFLLHG